MEKALAISPVPTCLVEEDFMGWKEFEREERRDKNHNALVVCPIENIDPIETLSDREYQI